MGKSGWAAARILEYRWEMVCFGGSFCNSRDLNVVGPLFISISGVIDQMYDKVYCLFNHCRGVSRELLDGLATVKEGSEWRT